MHAAELRVKSHEIYTYFQMDQQKQRNRQPNKQTNKANQRMCVKIQQMLMIGESKCGV